MSAADAGRPPTYFLCFSGLNFAGYGCPAQSHNAKQRLAEYTSAHFACTFAAVDKNYRHFLYLKAQLICSKLHLDLKSIALESDCVKVHRF